MRYEQGINNGRKPGLVPWLEHDITIESFAQSGEKGRGYDWVERKTRRELYQDRSALRSQTRGLLEKPFQIGIRVNKPLLVGNDLWQLDSEAKIVRNRRCPSFVGGPAVGPVEAGVDLDAVEHRRVPLEMAPNIGESIAMLTPNGPPRDTDPDGGWDQSLWNMVVHHPTLCSHSRRSPLRTARATWYQLRRSKVLNLPGRSRTRTTRARQLYLAAAAGVVCLVTVDGCAHGPRTPRPARHVNYWEALAELHPADAIGAAHNPAEAEFAEALGNLMSGDIEKAEERFGRLRTSATDSIIRAGSRVVYTATLQYQEKWQTLATLKDEKTTAPEVHDRASIELWANAFKDVPPKIFTFGSSAGRLQMTVSEVGTPLVPVKIHNKVYNFWLDTGSSLTMLASDVASELSIHPIVSDTLEIVTSTGRVSAQPALIPKLTLGPLTVDNAPAMIVEETMMRMPEPQTVGRFPLVKIDGIIGFDIIRQLDLELDYSEGMLVLRNPSRSRRESNRNMFWIGLPVIRIDTDDGQPLHFGLDTGAQLTFVTETLLDKLQISPARIENRRVGGLGGEISMRAPVMPDLRVYVRGFPIIFRGAFVRAPVYQVLASLDGVLGGDVWNTGIVRIDATNGIFAIRRPRNN